MGCAPGGVKHLFLSVHVVFFGGGVAVWPDLGDPVFPWISQPITASVAVGAGHVKVCAQSLTTFHQKPVQTLHNCITFGRSECPSHDVPVGTKDNIEGVVGV